MPESSHVSDADVLAAFNEIDEDQASGDAPVADDGWRDSTDVGADAAGAAWAEAGREVLLEAARRYHQVVTYKELAQQVQARTQISTTRLPHYWIGDVLKRITDECESRDEPLLSALAVKADGTVGDGYAAAVTAARGKAPADGDDHAAAERLACHRHFDAEGLPANGGVAALTPALANRRAREKKVRLEERPVPICPTCSMQIPATGVCDNCG